MAYIDAESTRRKTLPTAASVRPVDIDPPADLPDVTLSSSTASFHEGYEAHLGRLQKTLLEPLFFASIGFAIPFKDAWDRQLLWRGIVFSLLMVVGKMVVGTWILIWPWAPKTIKPLTRVLRRSRVIGTPLTTGQAGQGRSSASSVALLLGMAMVARGEISLLILQIGYNQSGKVSSEGFIVGTWAVVLNTIVGPVAVGVLVQRFGNTVMAGPWGIPHSA